VNVSADEGLYIEPARSQLSAPSVGPDAPAEWTIEVTPTREGRHLVRIDVQGRIDGVRQAHSVVAPIRVATVAKPGADNSVTGVAHDAVKTGADGAVAASSAEPARQPGYKQDSAPALPETSETGPAGEERQVRLPAVTRR